MGLPPFHDVYKTAEKYLNNECAPHLTDSAIRVLDAGSVSTGIPCAFLKVNGKKHVACEPEPATATPEKETLPQIEKKSIQLEQINAYHGPEGVRVFIAAIKNQKDAYLVKFQGIKGPWNNKTILHKAGSPDRDGSMNYWTEYDGAYWNSVLVRNCSGGYCQTKIYAPEQGHSDGVVVSYDDKESNKAKAQDLIATF